MPTWGDILHEINLLVQQKSPAPLDVVRRKYLAQLAAYTKRDTILYATRWTSPGPIPPDFLSITDEDVQGFMEVVHGLKSDNLDIIIHSPGGSAEATEAIVSYIRAKFKNLRIIVPQAAMSAATMLVCAADRVVLAKHSSLGPVDPQMILQTPLGVRAVPAQAILDQFEMAKTECQDPKKLGSWLPILSQFGPALLVQCRNALELSKTLTQDWLVKYMFHGERNAAQKAKKIASQLSTHAHFKSHGRHIDRAQAQAMGFNVDELEADQTLQDLVLSVFHATTHTLTVSSAVKIIENHQNRAFIKQTQPMQMQINQVVPIPSPTPAAGPDGHREN